MNKTSASSIRKSLGGYLTVIITTLTVFTASATSKLENYSIQKTVSDSIKTVHGVPVNPQDISPLLVGENMPQLQLTDANGKAFNLNANVAKKPTIVIFYRGGWCPYCSRQLSGLQDIEEELTKMGYQLLAISTDSPENLKNTETKEKLNYTLLSDADLNAAKKFGIAFRAPKNYDSFLGDASGGKNIHNLLPVPAVYILNKKGNIRFEYINPNISQRLNEGLLKAAAAALYKEL
ncbi:MAG: hypothetical protein BM557_02700 [Flavobacterium sp. MedPE-SWcel]|uniref:peroxiredoxin-like family protein n=1 Tax=uncultured Flavobacterium sp. TaxID=165435 RepID=UPI00091C1C3F|nr:peroxiredoxin-like family protein [uncultured Flavobacterium sp.]OIQ21837.1 MAG: hypothetical protein BM557_02700 [Flavobacterium sp. MedPE-SWcel]